MNGEFSSGHVERGVLLKEQGRFAEAEHYFRDALAQNPRDALAFHHLAACQLQLPNRSAEALRSIGEALALEPGGAAHHGLKALILCDLDRSPEALRVASAAVELAPDFSFVWTAKAQALLMISKWGDAESAARQALALDPDDPTAANQLAHALRLQNKMGENAEQIRGMLARDPESAWTHSTAGWGALQRGEHRAAEQHFLEALRLDPELEAAREGLLQSFRARSPIYRAYLNYCFRMQRLSKHGRWAVILGLYFGVRFSRLLFTGVYAPVGWMIAGLYVVFVFWVWVARGMGNFILLFDRFARHALRRGEKLEALFVGGGLTLGLALLLAGFAVKNIALLFMGIACCTSAIPFASTFTNGSRAGRFIFGAIGGCILLAGVAMTLSQFSLLSRELAQALFAVALGAGILSTWLGNISALRKPQS